MKKNPFLGKKKTYGRVHANLAERVVLHLLQQLLVVPLLAPEPLNNLQQFLLLHTAFEVHPAKKSRMIKNQT